MDKDDPWDEDGDEELEAEIMRADRPFGAELRGTTAREERAGESLDQELVQERPERPATDEAVDLEDDGLPDDEAQLVSDGSVEEDEFASPEESALTIRDEVPGATDHETTPTPIRTSLTEARSSRGSGPPSRFGDDQDVVRVRARGSTNPSHAKPDASSRFRPTATRPRALNGPKMVPQNARITPIP